MLSLEQRLDKIEEVTGAFAGASDSCQQQLT